LDFPELVDFTFLQLITLVYGSVIEVG